MKSSAPITIKHIAAALDISATAVSRALRGMPGVSEKLRERIRLKAARMNYVPNLAGAALSTGRFRTIAFVLPATPFPTLLEMDVLQGLISVVAECGYRISIISERYLDQAGMSVAQALSQAQCDGAVAFYLQTGQPHNLLGSLGMPLVIVNRVVAGLKADFVVTDDERGAYSATQHLIDLGHQTIAHLTGFQDNYNIRRRLLGFRNALVDRGHQMDERLVIATDHTREGGMRAAQQLLLRQIPFSALFCSDDAVALGALDVFKANGIKVPEDIAVVGFGDDAFSSRIDPPLTTVAKPRYEMGQQAGRLLMSRIEGAAAPASATLSLNTNLVIRRSSVKAE